jgi:hypothetical protein
MGSRLSAIPRPTFTPRSGRAKAAGPDRWSPWNGDTGKLLHTPARHRRGQAVFTPDIGQNRTVTPVEVSPTCTSQRPTLAYFGWPQAHEDEAERPVRDGSCSCLFFGFQECLERLVKLKVDVLEVQEVPSVRDFQVLFCRGA